MQTKTFFTDLFEYTHHCNQQLMELFAKYPDTVSEKSVRFFNHILNAHRVWNSRIEPGLPAFGVWDMHPSSDYASIEKDNYERSLLILDKHDLATIIQYKTTTGASFSNTVQEILFQVINHSTYHRGQIALECRTNNIDPLLTDYIFYKR